MLVGTGSGSGKTTVTCGVLKALTERHLSVASFKCGPDYIDPMFHSKIIGTKSRNLDLFLCGEAAVKFLLAKSAHNCDIAVIEGVMGMYDGLAANSDYASSNHLARLTGTPEVLIISVKGMSLSIAALIQGFLSFRPNNIKGVIFNNCTKGMYPVYKQIVEDELGIAVYGYLPAIPQAHIDSRHLGLMTVDEIGNIQAKLRLLADAAAECIDLDGLLALSRQAVPLVYEDIWQDAKCSSSDRIKLGVAKDKAFCFFYQDNLELLEKLGADIVYFSPLTDSQVPPDVCGLLFYGGYPEEYAQQLSQNYHMLASVKQALDQHMPTLAECGGFMYLLECLTDRQGVSHKMVGAIPGSSQMTGRLSRFGYVQLTAVHDNLLCAAGQTITAHEFHYSDSDNNGSGFMAAKKSKTWPCVHTENDLFAGYPHLHFGGNVQLAASFLAKCREFKQNLRN